MMYRIKPNFIFNSLYSAIHIYHCMSIEFDRFE